MSQNRAYACLPSAPRKQRVASKPQALISFLPVSSTIQGDDPESDSGSIRRGAKPRTGPRIPRTARPRRAWALRRPLSAPAGPTAADPAPTAVTGRRPRWRRRWTPLRLAGGEAVVAEAAGAAEAGSRSRRETLATRQSVPADAASMPPHSPSGSARSEKIVGREQELRVGIAVPLVLRDLGRGAATRHRAEQLEARCLDAGDDLAGARHLLAAVDHEAQRAARRRASGRRRSTPTRPRSRRSRARRARRARGGCRARASRRRRPPARRSRPARPRASLRTPGPFSSHSARSRPSRAPARLSTCACVHGSVAMPSSRPLTTSSVTPTRCASTSWTRHSGVAGAGRVRRRRVRPAGSSR